MNPSIATQRYESTFIPLNPGYWTKTGTTNKPLQKNPSKTTHATTRDATNNDQCMIQYNLIHDRVWYTIVWWQSEIWMYDRNSRVIGVSNMRWLQIWLKNFYRWSRKWSRCEESEWSVKNNTITRSILNLDQNILNSTFNLSSIREKMTRWSRWISRNMCEYENVSFTFL